MMHSPAMVGVIKPPLGGGVGAFLLLILSFCAYGDALLCYRCENAVTNEECNTANNLVDCKNVSLQGSARPDTCQTRVSNTADGARYFKGCVVGPCTLDGNQDVALGLADCDDSADSWDCEYCCSDDKCNASAATCLGITLTTVTWSLMVLFGVFKNTV